MELAHDLKNLLTILTGCVDALERQTAPHAAAAHVADIRYAIDCASEIVSEMLGFGQRCARRPPVIELNQTLGGMRAMLGRFLGPDIRLMMNLAAAADAVAIHPLDLERIVYNLVLNARDAMWEGDELTIETATITRSVSGLDRPDRLGTFVRLTVGDTGPGIPVLLHARVFEPFYTTRKDATGLGLSVIALTVNRLNGQVQIESKPGRGTRVHVDLPLVSES
jgi:signal transduction histidine kinase